MNLDRIIAVRTGKTVYSDEGRAIKVFDSDYPKADILSEALNQARAEETGLNVPSVLEVTTIEGKWAIASEYIKGPTLEQLMAANPDKCDEYIELFVDIQLDIHSRICPLLCRLKDKIDRKILDSELEATLRYDLYSRIEEMPGHKKLCHGDFNPSNVIISDGGKAYIVDWSHAAQGNASADVASTYLYFRLANEKKLGDKYIDAYCQRSGVSKQYVLRWIPIVAASLSVTGRPEEKELCLSIARHPEN